MEKRMSLSLFSFILGLCFIFMVSLSEASSVSFPPTGPSGSFSGGMFGTYFQNMTVNPCPTGQAIYGFGTGSSSYGAPLCRSISGGGGSSFWNSLDGGINIYFTGSSNVGIGTTTPTAKLDVNGVSRLGTSVWGYNWVQGNGGTQSYKIATLPTSTASTYDHLVLDGVFDDNWGATSKSTFHIVMGNRNGFSYKWQIQGDIKTFSKIVAYQESDASVSVYAVLVGSTYSSISLNIPESYQVITYASPSSTTPTGSIVFDSSSSNYKPQFMVDAAGNISGNSSLLPYYAGGSAGAMTGRIGKKGLYSYNTYGDTNTPTYFGAGVGFGNGDGGSAEIIANWTDDGGLWTRYLRDCCQNWSSWRKIVVESTGGLVGIGTTNPGSKLTVAGMIESTASGVKFPDGSVQTSAFSGGAYSGLLSMWNKYGNALYYTSGNVGIGTSAPSATLDVAGRTSKFSNLFPEYSYRHGGGTDLNWKTIANLTLGTGLYVGGSFQVDITDASTNWGHTANAINLQYFVSMQRSGGVQDDMNTASVSGPISDYVRIVKTAVGVYEVQVRQVYNYTELEVKARQIGANSFGVGGTLTYVDTPVNGSTTGTIYAPAATNTSSFSNGYFAGSIIAGNNLAGTAHSLTLKTNAGLLGSTVGSELGLGSIGFTANNAEALGIRAYRNTAGSDWTSTAIGIGMDVDNTIRAGASIWLNANGNVGIGTTTPSTKLQVSGGMLSFIDTPANAGNGNTGIQGNPNGWTRLDPNGNKFIITPTAAQVTAGTVVLDIEDTSWGHRMELRADGSAYFSGNMGIGTTNPGEKLEVNGNAIISGTAYATDFSWLSDKKFKEHIVDTKYGLTDILALRPVEYTFKKEYQSSYHFPSSHQVGFIAQEVESIIPEIVNTKENGDKSVDYAKLTPLLTKAIQDQQKQIETLRKENTELSKKIDLIEKELKK